MSFAFRKNKAVTDGYIIQKLSSACEFLVSSKTIEDRLNGAHAELLALKLHGHDSREPFSDQFGVIFNNLEMIDQLTSEEMESTSQLILEMLISALQS